MSGPPRRELGLVVVALVVLAGLVVSSAPASTSVSGVPLAAPAPPTSSPPSPPTSEMVTTTEAPATTSTSTALRSIAVTVHPEEAPAELVLTTADGETVDLVDGSAEASGPLRLEVSAAGYRAESVEIDAVATQVDVWLDPPDQLVDLTASFSTGAAPKQVAFTPDGGELWVTLLGGTGLEAYDPASGELIAAIDLPEAGSVEVIFDQSGEKAFVSQMETASVYEIDVSTHRMVRQLETGRSWTKVVLLAPDESTLWASNWVSNDVTEFDLSTGEATRQIATVTTPRGLALSADGGRLYVAGYDDGDLEVVDLATGEGTVLTHTGGALRHLVADPEQNLIYASDMALDTIYVVDTTTDEVTTMGTTDRLPNTIDLSPDGRVLAVSNRGRNNPETYYLPGPEWGSVLLLDTETGEILDAIVGGNQPTGLDISPDGAWLAYSDFLDDRVRVYALPTTAELVAGGGGRAGTYRTELAK